MEVDEMTLTEALETLIALSALDTGSQFDLIRAQTK